MPRGASGFGLAEVLIAGAIFLIGAVAVAQLLTATTVMHLASRNAAEATRLAQAKVEELAKADFAADPAIQITPAGSASLDNNVANYFDAPVADRVTRRWEVQAGPTATTRRVTVRVLYRQGSPGARTVDLTTLVRQW